ncbi:hypothetical protein CCMA1212_000157 [Trichoderma ghanense]|uniref:Secreted protein n=1 Tax=Trichoderma ghanense TaxID=65468 RepID=A0ABY2HG83_9HYPO
MARILGSSCRLVTLFDAAVQSPQGQPPLSQRTSDGSAGPWASLSAAPPTKTGSRIVNVFALCPLFSCAGREGSSESESGTLASALSPSPSPLAAFRRRGAAGFRWPLFLVPIDTKSWGGPSTGWVM